jgi:hypothetical protein
MGGMNSGQVRKKEIVSQTFALTSVHVIITCDHHYSNSNKFTVTCFIEDKE